MRISKLSAQAGLPVGTVKFYLRTGLLHPGLATSATQAIYDETHLARLRLVRALLEVGGLSLAEIHRIVDAETLHSDDPEKAMAQTQEALAGKVGRPGEEDLGTAQALLDDLGWHVNVDSPHLPSLARALQALTSVGIAIPIELMQVYADSAARLAHEDQTHLATTSNAERPTTAAAAAVLFDAVFTALRRLAGENLRDQEPGSADSPLMAMPVH